MVSWSFRGGLDRESLTIGGYRIAAAWLALGRLAGAIYSQALPFRGFVRLLSSVGVMEGNVRKVSVDL